MSEEPRYVTNKQLYDELTGVGKEITSLKVAVRVMVPIQALVALRVFGIKPPAAPDDVAAGLFALVWPPPVDLVLALTRLLFG